MGNDPDMLGVLFTPPPPSKARVSCQLERIEKKKEKVQFDLQTVGFWGF